MKKIIVVIIIYFLAGIFYTHAQTLYGMTNSGGASGYGVIFSFDPSTSTYNKLKDFDNANGSTPYGSLMQARDGNLYGMTGIGGSSGVGVIFSFDPYSSTYSKVKDFDNTNGYNPFGGLIEASDGKLYGMTSAGGSSNVGVIFSFDPSSSTYAKLKDFDYPNGAFPSPSNSLMQASDGKLYGVTEVGGSNYSGVIFSFDPSSSTYTKLKDFDNPDGSTDGSFPFGSLMQASDGKLYGMTLDGGNNGLGVIFSFDPSTSTYTKLKDFDNANGGTPYGSLMQANDGKLYGMTGKGGSGGVGVIFSFDPTTSIYTKLKDFNNANGGTPYGSLMQASDGKLYGMTAFGGSSDVGVIFSFDPSSATYTKLKDFNGANGATPSCGSAFIEVLLDENLDFVSSFTLVNAITDKDIQAIPDGSVLDKTALPPNLNIRANTTPTKVGSVVFILDGQKVRTENGFPYALAGDFPVGDYLAWSLPLGDHTLTAIPYSDHDGKGTQGRSLTIHFTVIGPRVNTFTLVNATTDKDIQAIPDGSVLDKTALPPNLNIRANTTATKVGSVVFILDGQKVRTENGFPYALAGDFPVGDYQHGLCL